MKYTKHTLSNGLRVLLHEDANTPLCTLNLLYNVGARDEDPSRTGFAHLFEHLMFGGTERYPDFDLVVDTLCGESNAFTNSDYTNYYMTIPSQYLDQALALEADRMCNLAITQHALEVQQGVVTEEYHQRYLGKPYQDAGLLRRPLAYKCHPYRWETIGADIRHVSEATLDDVTAFHERFYTPNNAILAVAGNIHSDETLTLIERHFGTIPAGTPIVRNLPQEPLPLRERRLSVCRETPAEALYMNFPMCHRLHPDFPASDLISDLLSSGDSSRMYLELVKRQQLFTSLSAYVSGLHDDGLFLIVGKLSDGVAIPKAEEAVWKVLNDLMANPVTPHELEKVVNRYEVQSIYEKYKASDRAQMLCDYEWNGRLDWIDSEPELYRQVSPHDIQRVAQSIFQPSHLSVIEYRQGTPQKPLSEEVQAAIACQ